MHITDYELFEVPPRWLFLKVTTSDGTVGWGEPIVEGRSKTVEAAVEELMEAYLVGEDPRGSNITGRRCTVAASTEAVRS